MDAQAYDCSQERIAFHSMDNHAVKAIIVKDTVIDPLGTGAVFVDLLVFIRASGDRWIKPDIPFRFCVDHTPI